VAVAASTRRRTTRIFDLAWIVLFAVGGMAVQGEPLAYDAPVGEARDFSRTWNALPVG
jgi:hypothetical protein